MKPTPSLLAFIFGSVFLTAQLAHADTLYWDGGTVDIGTDGNGLSGGTAGNWNTTLLNWDQGANLPHVAWDNTNTLLNPADTAVFGGTAGNVTLQTPITVGGLTFLSSTGYTLTSGTNGLSFGATNNTIRLLNSANGTTSAATISGTVGGTGNVILTSINPVVTSNLTFNGTSAGGWSGSTTINQGTTLTMGVTANQALLNTSAININGGTISSLRNSGTAQDQISNSAAITFNGGGTLSFTNNIGASFTETIGAITIASGQANIVHTNGSSGSGVVTTIGGLSRTATTSAVTFSNPNTAQVAIRVTGAADTAANQIIGSWATFGSSAALQSDYAIYTGANGTLAAANIAGSTEDTWTNATDSYTLNTGSAVALTGTRTISALKFIGATSNLSLGDNNLETYGVLWGDSNANKNILGGGTGVLTTPTGGGNLFLTVGQNVAHTVSANIANNTGNVTVVKSGVGTLNLSGTNTYTGGTVLNAGTLAIGNINHIGGSSANLTFNGNARLSVSADLNFSGGTLTVNQGANAVITKTANSVTTFATTAGDGNLIYEASSVSRRLNLGDASGFDGNLTVRLTGNANYALNTTVQFSSLGDGVGSALQFVGGTSDSNQAMTVVLVGGSAPVVFDNRKIQTLPRLGGNHSPRYAGISNNNASAANTWTINTDLEWGFNTNGSSTNKEFRLGGSNTGNNAFNGVLSQGQAPDVLNVSKIDAGKWILGGANTYTGFTDVRAGTLEIGGSGTLGNVSAGVGNYAGNISIASTSSGRLVYNSSADQTLSGVISGAGALFVEDGSLTLTNTNGYTGATNVNGGSLIIDGSTASTSVVTVGEFGTLGGGGLVGGATTISGNLTPGNSPGVLAFGQTLTLQSTATTTMEILGLNRDTQYDGVDVTGELTYGGELVIDFDTTFGGGSYNFNLFDFGSTVNSFSDVTLAGLYSGSLTDNGFGVWGLNSGANTWTFTQSTGDLNLTVIPEPTAALLGSLGLLTLLRRRR